VGTKGYICLGTNGSSHLTDLWEWDQPTDNWSEKASFPGPARREAAGFTIGNIGYVGFGRTSPGGTIFNDLWAYDPATDQWAQRAPLPAEGRSAPGVFVLGGRAYGW